MNQSMGSFLIHFRLCKRKVARVVGKFFTLVWGK